MLQLFRLDANVVHGVRVCIVVLYKCSERIERKRDGSGQKLAGVAEETKSQHTKEIAKSSSLCVMTSLQLF